MRLSSSIVGCRDRACPGYRDRLLTIEGRVLPIEVGSVLVIGVAWIDDGWICGQWLPVQRILSADDV